MKRMRSVFLQDWGQSPVMRCNMKKMIPALLLFVVCGCARPYNFSPYVGQQQNWGIQPGGFVKVVDGAHLYPPGQFPDRPYIVIGDVSTHSLADHKWPRPSMNNMPTPRSFTMTGLIKTARSLWEARRRLWPGRGRGRSLCLVNATHPHRCECAAHQIQAIKAGLASCFWGVNLVLAALTRFARFCCKLFILNNIRINWLGTLTGQTTLIHFDSP